MWTWRRLLVIGVVLVLALGGWIALEMTGGPVVPVVFSGP